MKTKLHLVALAASAFFMSNANAKLWDILTVEGCSSGFCASLFHSSSGTNPM